MQSYQIEYPKSNLKQAIQIAFNYIEVQDEIVGSVYVAPAMAKRITIELSDDVIFDYIPEGIGMLRTAYLKFLPSIKENELRFLNQEKTMELKLFLI